MQFISPTFLWALAALAIPVIIHLFHFRRFKKVYFTNVHLLQELKEETSTRNKLRSLLILLSRCAALAMLVFAFAQPIIKSGDINQVENRAVEIIVDNSFSMEARDTEVPLMTIAKDRAREIINSYDESDIYLILTHDLEPKHQRFVDQKTALGFLDDIAISPAVESLEDISSIAKRIRKNIADHQHYLYVLSDFQENISSFSSPVDTTIEVSLVPFRAIQESNVAILNASWEAPLAVKDQNNRLVVELYNYSDESQAVELRMNYEGQERPLGSIRLQPNTASFDTINVTVNRTGWHELQLSIDDYPVTFDNELYLSFDIADQIDVTSVYQNARNTYVQSAFESISYYNLTQQSKSAIRYEAFQDQELIILDDLTDISSGLSNELIKYVNNGGNLLVFPPNAANINSYNNLLGQLGVDRLREIEEKEREVFRINTDEFIFNNVYENRRRNIRLPKTKRNFALSSQQSAGKESLLRYRDGSPFLQKFNVEKGNVYLCSAAMNENTNDLVINAEVFVPMLYKMALSIGSRKPLSYTIGKDDVISSSSLGGASAEQYLIKGTTEFIPAISSSGNTGFMDIRGQISTAGFYDLTAEDKLVETLAFNYDRKESEVSYGEIKNIAAQIGPDVKIIDDVVLADLSGYISERQEGTRLWRWCLILALLFLLLEIGLIRLWK